MDQRLQPIISSAAISPRLFRLGLALLVIAAAWLRFDGLAKRELWFDENCTFYIIHHLYDWPPDGPDPWREVAHTPYFFLLHVWTRFTGETIWGLRSFSALIGCLGVGAVGLVGTRLGGRTVGFISATLAALHPLHIHYSQEARSYAMWMLVVTGCLYLLYQATRSLRTRWWVAYGALTWVAVLTHYCTLLWPLGTVAAALLTDDRRRFWRHWLITHFALGIALAPVVWFLVVPLAQGGSKPWFRQMWMTYPPALAIPKSLWAMLPSGGYPEYLGTLTAAGETVTKELGVGFAYVMLWGPAVLLMGLAVVLVHRHTLICGRHGQAKRRHVVANTRRRQPTVNSRTAPLTHKTTCDHALAGKRRALARSGRAASRTENDQTAVMWLMLSLTLAYLVGSLLYSCIVEPTYIVGRYDLAAWPSLILGVALVVHGAARSVLHGGAGQTAARVVLTALLAACSGITIFGMWATPISNNATARARQIAALVGPDDLVISLGKYRLFMTYEWHHLGFSPRMMSFPTDHERQLCWYDAEAELANPAQIAADALEVSTVIEEALAEGTRVWLLAHGEPAGPRWKVDSQLYTRLRELGIDVQIPDERLGLMMLARTP